MGVDRPWQGGTPNLWPEALSSVGLMDALVLPTPDAAAGGTEISAVLTGGYAWAGGGGVSGLVCR